MICALILFATLAGQDTAELSRLPSDISGSMRGAAAVGADAAAVGRVDGFELQVRRGQTPTPGQSGGWGLFSAIPFGRVTAGFGYDTQGGNGNRLGRTSLSLSSEFARRWYFGAAYRYATTQHVGVGNAHIFDVGIFGEATSWLSVSLGFDGIGGDTLDKMHFPGTARVGVAVRPLRAAPYLTLSGDTRVRGNFDDPAIAQSRFLVDVSPVSGTHAQLSYTHTTGIDELWAGVSVALGGVEAYASTSVYNPDDKGVAFDHAAMALTLRANPTASRLHPPHPSVHITLRDKLQEPSLEFWAPTKVISTKPLELAELASDSEVETVELQIDHLDVGLGVIEELRQGIHLLRAQGKKVIANISSLDDKSYMVAASCDTIRMDPLGTLSIDGFGVTVRYYADALAKIGVQFEAVGIGKYKSGPDPLSRNSARPEDREVIQGILDQAMRKLQHVLKKDRKLDDAKIAAVFQAGMINAPQALELGLIDDTTLPIDPTPVPPQLPELPPPPSPSASALWNARPSIVIIPVVGTIAATEGANPLPGRTAAANVIKSQIEQATADANVRAVVLRVDSPGGDVIASETLWRALRQLAERKPLVVSMGDVAASGGYYIATPGHVIFADPTSITGSIGIFSLRPNIKNLLNMTQIHAETYKAGERANWESIDHPLSEEDKKRLETHLKYYYDAFVQRVALGRRLTVERAGELAQGRVYTGEVAHELGLVDTLGSLHDAIEDAKERAGLSPTSEVEIVIPEQPFAWSQVLGQMTHIKSAVNHSAMSQAANFVQDLDSELQRSGHTLYALMPAIYEVDP